MAADHNRAAPYVKAIRRLVSFQYPPARAFPPAA